jgi:hypothetical protein
MSILDVVQGATKLLKNMAVPSTVVGSGNRLTLEMVQLLSMCAADLRNRYDWVELHRVYTFPATGEASYPIPEDFERLISNTVWSTSGMWPLVGPLTPQKWRALQSGIGIAGPPPQFRIYGSGNVGPGTKQFFVNPIDSTGTLAYEYKTRNWVFPPNWQPNTGITIGQYRSYGSNVYKAEGSGTTTGTNPPVHTTGSENDGGVTWTYTALYDAPTSDLDTPIFDTELLIWGLVYFFLASNKMEHAFSLKQYDTLARIKCSGKRGSTTISMSNYSTGPHFIDESNIPDTGYGN